MATIARYYGSGADTANKAWVTISGRSAVSVDLDDRTDEQLIAAVETYWQNADSKKRAEEALREKYPGTQIYGGLLPHADVEWGGEPGYYTYCLKPRRKNGKYQVLAVA